MCGLNGLALGFGGIGYAPFGKAGGVYNYDLDASLTLTNSTISGLNADRGGGAIYNRHGTVEIQDSTIALNTSFAHGDGGGGIIHLGENRWLAESDEVLVTLAAAINADQTE